MGLVVQLHNYCVTITHEIPKPNEPHNTHNCVSCSYYISVKNYWMVTLTPPPIHPLLTCVSSLTSLYLAGHSHQPQQHCRNKPVLATLLS